jgi:hypothetical protein
MTPDQVVMVFILDHNHSPLSKQWGGGDPTDYTNERGDGRGDGDCYYAEEGCGWVEFGMQLQYGNGTGHGGGDYA